jgi:hypothetical protein
LGIMMLELDSFITYAGPSSQCYRVHVLFLAPWHCNL